MFQLLESEEFQLKWHLKGYNLTTGMQGFLHEKRYISLFGILLRNLHSGHTYIQILCDKSENLLYRY